MADLVIAALTLAAIMPLMAVVAAAVYLTDPGPILFRHARLGRSGRTFHCLKFRSMVVDAETRLARVLADDPALREQWAREHKLLRDPRITSIGRFIRASSLDELPQLFNVLRGEMSLVGPRPIVAAEVVRYGRFIEDYYRVMPGITGLWQISGRNDVSYRRRVALDVAFARSLSIGLYFRILFLTVPAVVMARGSY